MKILFVPLPAFALLFALACNSDGGPQIPPAITSQPASQSVTVGQAATFTVLVSGTGPLSYQWYWNGVAVKGGGVASATFTTPATVPADNQSTFTVSVTNRVGTVTSAQAILTVPGSPLPPKKGDLRFKDVDAFPLGVPWFGLTDFYSNMALYYHDSIGTPLMVGWAGTAAENPGFSGVDWFYAVGNLPEGAASRSTGYGANNLTHFQSDLVAAINPVFNDFPPFGDPDTIVSSLDFCPGQNVYAVELVSATANGGYSLGTQTLAMENLQGASTEEGASGRVITAVTLQGTQATYLSYGWQGDAATVYETRAVTATSSAVGASATDLAQQGYIITAFGGNDTDGFLLVGTRAQGQTAPRTLTVGGWADYPGRGSACVGMYDQMTLLFEQ